MTPSAVIAGLVPAIPITETPDVRQYYLYILASRPGGAIYVASPAILMRDRAMSIGMAGTSPAMTTTVM
jgi:hypothetical protein